MEIKTSEEISVANYTKVAMKKWVAVNDIILEIDKLRADVSNCIPKEFMEKYINRFDIISNLLSEKEPKEYT